MSQEKFSDVIQIRVSPDMKKDLESLGGDMSHHIREFIDMGLRAKKNPIEQTRKEYEYHMAEAEKRRIVIEKHEEEEKKGIEERDIEKKSEDKFNEVWPEIRKYLDKDGLRYTLENPEVICKYSKKLDITQPELKDKIKNRYNKEYGEPKKKVVEKSIRERFDGYWPKIKECIDKDGLENTLDNPNVIMYYSKRLKIEQFELKQMIKERYSEEIEGNIKYCDVMTCHDIT